VEREQKIEPVEAGCYRGVESDDVVSLTEGVPQPIARHRQADATKRVFCDQRHLEMRSDRRDRPADLREVPEGMSLDDLLSTSPNPGSGLVADSGVHPGRVQPQP
jgi:hypothetical protein